ncbi:cysteine hydrolase family protein [Paramaledivibacter caminithermalis]|jgi:nicotinamidase-related amidase|uniref:Nicotinamidase-related amidase n=1 Tax=Paramaledivibacter caminithermalis (strain DSM 15212 / CIP 107654 / DViRD3) TaxID=1121301 RepID=A0A1M6RBZ2_PARC5|nr:isochorismatase family cysteine hydrolase [Paramaledivibacter caminithermalis]SHK30015.1 Nicotinamidase-related amidase [Paramaledivibacter caminithermalis DSM 15212]
MLNLDKQHFLKRSTETLDLILNTLESLPSLNLRDLRSENTVLIIIDMVNGFAREGALQSPRVEALIPEIVKISRGCDENRIAKIAFADCHTEQSPEFDAYPVHCMRGTSESMIVEELREIGGYSLISKNSTNAFLEERFQEWLKTNSQINTFIIIGDCTDICIEQFAVTLKAYFNMKNKKVRIIVPINAVDTYDYAIHNGDLMHVMALFNMMSNGIELVSGIE